MKNITINYYKEKDVDELNTNEELRNYIGYLGVITANKSIQSIEIILKKITSRLQKCDEVTRCFSLDTLVNYIENCDSVSQEIIIDMYTSLVKCHQCNKCCKNNYDIAKSLVKMAHQVTYQNQLKIREYLYSQKCDYENNEDIFEELIKYVDNAIEDNSIQNEVINSQFDLTKLVGKKLKIGLLVPEFLSASSFLQPPIDMLTLASNIRKSGHEIVFLDNRVNHYSLTRISKYFNAADVIVVTSTPYDHIQNYFVDYRLKYTFKTINAIKKVQKDKLIIACGAHSSLRPDIVFKESSADIVIRWEYDFLIADMIEWICENKDINNLDNVCIRGKNYESEMIPKHPNYDLNSDTLPAYDLIDFDKYYGDVYKNNILTRKKNWSVMLGSRGCQFNCAFCFNFWGNKVRFRTPEHVVKELLYLYEKTKVRDIFFIDFNFTFDKNWAKKVCELIVENNIHMNFSAQVRCDTVDLELLQTMATANFKSLWFGVESFEDDVRINSKKYKNSDIIINAIENCKEVGIQPQQFIIVGLPGETRESMKKTLNKVQQLNIPYSENVLVFTPRMGSEFYNLAKEEFEFLGDDFYSLGLVKTLVDNNITPKEIQDTQMIYRNREFTS